MTKSGTPLVCKMTKSGTPLVCKVVPLWYANEPEKPISKGTDFLKLLKEFKKENALPCFRQAAIFLTFFFTR